MSLLGRVFGRAEKVDPLGEGVWRRAHDRFVRAVDRVHQATEKVPPGPARQGLDDVCARLAGLVGDVYAVCEAAQAAMPSAGLEIPGGPDGRYLDAHREVSRAATLTAQVAESATMARVALRAGTDPTGSVTAAWRVLEQAQDHVSAATALVRPA